MKKLTLLGDSIRLIGYGQKVTEELRDEYLVYQPEDNGRFSKYTLRGVLREWTEDISGSDVVFWNCGLWDMADHGDGPFTSEEEYVINMTRIAKLLKEKAKTVIFATTTPVASGNEFHDNKRIIRYNNLIVPKLKSMGIIICDLHSVVYPNIDKYIRTDDKAHLTIEGSDACAKAVVQAIRGIQKGEDKL